MDDCVMRSPKLLRTPAKILEEKPHYEGRSEIMGFPLSPNYRPRAEDFSKLTRTELVLYGYQYFLVDGTTGSHYDDFLKNVCRSYVALGYFPPALISDFQGDKDSLQDEDVLVIAACKASLTLAKQKYEMALKSLCKRFGI